MSVAVSTYAYVYQSIRDVPEYVAFRSTPFSWPVVFLLTTLLYTVPCVVVFARIAVFYFRSGERIRKNGLRIEMFQSFLLMQFWNNVSVLADFLMFRVPNSTLFTAFCASQNPQVYLKIVVFLYHWSIYTAEMTTVLFCVLRVAILYFAPKQSRKTMVTVVPSVMIVVGFLMSLPHLLSDGLCLQLFEPYPFGSLVILSKFHYDNLNYVVLWNLFLHCAATLVVVLMNVLMLLKIRERRALSMQARNFRNSKAESTLTGTMIILVVPMIVSQLVALGELFHFEILSYILLLRPVFLDTRVHVVSVYFYVTHPVFKKPLTNPPTSISHTYYSRLLFPRFLLVLCNMLISGTWRRSDLMF